MVDLGTCLAAVAAAQLFDNLGIKDALLRVLGPTLDDWGEDFKAKMAQHRNKNFAKIIEAADRRIRNNSIPNINEINNTILSETYVNSTIFDGAVYAEYCGGVLASSKMHNKNDIGQSILKLIYRLSSYELRFHYLYYMILSNKFKGKEINLGDESYADLCGIYISESDVVKSMEFSEEEIQNKNVIFDMCMTSLVREKLIGSMYAYAQKGSMIEDSKMPEDGFFIRPTSTGANLFLWGTGYGMSPASEIFSEKKDFTILSQIYIPEAIYWGYSPRSGYARDVIPAKKFVNYLMGEDEEQKDSMQS